MKDTFYLIKENDEFFNSFVWSNKTLNKSFAKFVEKTESNLLTYLCTVLINEKTISNKLNKLCFTEAMKLIIKDYYFNLAGLYESEHGYDKDYVFIKKLTSRFSFMNMDLISDSDSFKHKFSKEAITYYFDDANYKKLKRIDISKFINNALYNECKDLIALNCMELNADTNESIYNVNNFISLVPDTSYLLIDFISRIFLETVSEVNNSLEYVCENLINDANNTLCSNNNSSITALSDKVAQLTSELNEANKKLEAATKYENEYKKLEHEYSKLKDASIALTNKNSKLDERCKRLEAKLDDANKELKVVQINNTSDNSEEVHDTSEDITEVLKVDTFDYNAKYVFIMDNWVKLETEIKSVFPNATFVKTKANLNPKNIDLVVLMPHHLGHTLYWDAKKQCKDKDIPFIHCNATNCAMIREAIINCKDFDSVVA